MLNQATGYAATALGYLASAGSKPVLVKDIAEASQIPSPYLAKIINALARKGLLNTQRGIGGGVTLGRAAATITLYDLAGADPAVRFSPYCWRTRFSLQHKGLSFEAKPWRFTEKDRLPDVAQGRVPAVVDHDRQWVVRNVRVEDLSRLSTFRHHEIIESDVDDGTSLTAHHSCQKRAR